ncbi:hypothetical protein AncyloWKF20_05280 [Ancylobacter sp. WKF20]|uniref:hypothetical protein n=1 Tax=Ancylobacter sp. WKF20 TaxID=3039801 RepID=UPI00243446AB|nr:hypothetical protein [Ancylobacter sp. WKF20]WGD31237.1 hypothetical protein AncyloWKF20_05280 [Ancylobacter sp. WKF20]
MFRRALLSAGAAVMSLMGAALPASPSSDQPRREPPPQPRRSPAQRHKPTPRPVDVKRGADYLGKRSLHPGHSSSIRKLQRAFRLAGTHFVVGAPVGPKGRGQ